MTFHNAETSISDGKPVRLYEFKRGVMRWLYNSGDRDILFNNGIYKTLVGGIIDEGVKRTGSVTADRMHITAPADIEFAQMYRAVPPADEIDLIIYDYHSDTTGAVIAWSGFVEMVGWPSLEKCKISAQTLLATLDVPGLRLTWERNCGAALYDHRCKVNRDAYRAEITVLSLDGTSVQSGALQAYGDNWFTGGFVEWPVSGGNYELRAIESHITTNLVLMGGTSGIKNGQTLRVYPGCSRTIHVCHTKFGNKDNFRADPNLMGRNIFDGNPVF